MQPDPEDTAARRGPESPVEAFRDQLGHVPDAEIARLAGVTRSGVQKYRQRHGIPAPTETGVKRRGRPTAIPEHLLGQLSDAEIARQSGRTRSAVQKLRTRRGIAPHGDDVSQENPVRPEPARGDRWVWRLRIATSEGEITRFTEASDIAAACAAGAVLGAILAVHRADVAA